MSRLTPPAHRSLTVRGRASTDREPYASSTTRERENQRVWHTHVAECICNQICDRLRCTCLCAPLVTGTARAKAHVGLPNQAMIFLRPFSGFWGPGSKRQSAEDTKAAADDQCLAAPLQFFTAVLSILLHRNHTKRSTLFLALAIS